MEMETVPDCHRFSDTLVIHWDQLQLTQLTPQQVAVEVNAELAGATESTGPASWRCFVRQIVMMNFRVK
jgi:hypothetical protein